MFVDIVLAVEHLRTAFTNVNLKVPEAVVLCDQEQLRAIASMPDAHLIGPNLVSDTSLTINGMKFTAPAEPVATDTTRRFKLGDQVMLMKYPPPSGIDSSMRDFVPLGSVGKVVVAGQDNYYFVTFEPGGTYLCSPDMLVPVNYKHVYPAHGSPLTMERSTVWSSLLVAERAARDARAKLREVELVRADLLHAEIANYDSLVSRLRQTLNEHDKGHRHGETNRPDVNPELVEQPKSVASIKEQLFGELWEVVYTLAPRHVQLHMNKLRNALVDALLRENTLAHVNDKREQKTGYAELNTSNYPSVTQVIEFLQRQPPDAKVYGYDGEGGSWIIVQAPHQDPGKTPSED